MNPSIKRLADTASKSERKIIGLMSGTSLDGLDIALCTIQGSGQQTSVELSRFETKSYDSRTKRRLKNISSVSNVSLEEVCLLHSWLGNYHGSLILETLKNWNISPSEIDCIASHGQTIYHAPAIQHGEEGMPNTTLQIGDGDHIAYKTGILTISDFRQKHTAAGGEGAPMVSLVDRILFSHETEDRILLNIGGIANFTWLPASQNDSRRSLTTDTGPGNTLIDAAAQEFFEIDFDEEGSIAQQGEVHTGALDILKSHPYFRKSMPKTTGPEVFNVSWVNNQLVKAGFGDITPESLVATLTRFSAETIANSIKELPVNSKQAVIYVSGGGVHNPVLMKWIEKLLPSNRLRNFSDIGFDPDAKEAVLFAVLANETLSGSGFLLNDSDHSKKANFGKISFPH